jgi:DNA polymerase-4
MGQVFYDFSRGIDKRPVISEWERKSVSCEQTFESDISGKAAVTIHLYHTVFELVRRITVDHILRTKDEILPLAKQLMKQVEFFDKQNGYAERQSHPIRLLGLGVSNQKTATPQEDNQWIELELEFEPWPEK